MSGLLRGEFAKLKRGETSSLHRADPGAKLGDLELAAAGALIERLKVALEPDIGEAAASGLAALGHEVTFEPTDTSFGFGGAQAPSNGPPHP